jgi:hypothetical protein
MSTSEIDFNGHITLSCETPTTFPLQAVPAGRRYVITELWVWASFKRGAPLIAELRAGHPPADGHITLAWLPIADRQPFSLDERANLWAVGPAELALFFPRAHAKTVALFRVRMRRERLGLPPANPPRLTGRTEVEGGVSEVPAEVVRDYLFELTGKNWHVRYCKEYGEFSDKNCKGFACIARLLSKTGQAVPADDLEGRPVPEFARTQTAQPATDAEGRRRTRDRKARLEQEIEEARRDGALAKALELEEELAQVTQRKKADTAQGFNADFRVA